MGAFKHRYLYVSQLNPIKSSKLPKLPKFPKDPTKTK